MIAKMCHYFLCLFPLYRFIRNNSIRVRWCTVPKSGANISLTSYDDIFSTEENRQTEQIHQISISELQPLKDHPFKVLDDEAMQRTV